jgi:hypothetical protein
MKKAIAFITLRPSQDLIDFSKELIEKTNYDVFIFIDDDDYNITDINNNINYIKIDKNECIKNGFQWVTRLYLNPNSLQVCSWDKALYYFSVINTSYDFIWGLEDDVFIPSVDTIINLDKYINPDVGLVSAKNIGNYDGNLKWLWVQAKEANLKLPWYSSMVPAVGISKNLMNLIRDFAKYKGYLVLTEIIFNTLAMHNNINVINPPELSTIVYRQNWTLDDFKNNKNNLFHPVKDVNNHKKYRNYII